MEVEISQENHNASKPAYAVGNVTFQTNFITEVYVPAIEYFFYYSFGDNTSAILKGYTPYTTYIHNYTGVCNNCSYDVTVILLELLKTPRAQYCPEYSVPINVISE